MIACYVLPLLDSTFDGALSCAWKDVVKSIKRWHIIIRKQCPSVRELTPWELSPGFPRGLLRKGRGSVGRPSTRPSQIQPEAPALIPASLWVPVFKRYDAFPHHLAACMPDMTRQAFRLPHSSLPRVPTRCMHNEGCRYRNVSHLSLRRGEWAPSRSTPGHRPDCVHPLHCA
jgi:hypothetical protein